MKRCISCSKSFVFNSLILLLLLLNSAFSSAVPEISVSPPDPALVNACSSDFVTYQLDYKGDASLLLLDDPALFYIYDEDNTPIIKGGTVAFGGPTRRYVAMKIPFGLEGGVYHLYIAAGSAMDGGGSLGEVHDVAQTAFTVASNWVETCPITIQISEPSSYFTSGDSVTYQVSYVNAQSSRLFSGYLQLYTEGSVSATISSTYLSGHIYEVRLDNITGKGKLGFKVLEGSALNYSGEIAGESDLSPLVEVDVDAGPVDTDDSDNDGVPNYHEDYIDLTNKYNSLSYRDSDRDLVPDYVERNGLPTDIDGVFGKKSNPYDIEDFVDTDLGGTADYIERLLLANIGLTATDENDESDDQRDSDGDGLPDALEFWLSRYSSEVAIEYSASDADLPVPNGDDDSDGVSNAVELYLKNLLELEDITAATDFDRDGYFDADEVKWGLNPLKAQARIDGNVLRPTDGIDDRVEVAALTELGDTDLKTTDDFDSDGLPDFLELISDRAAVTITGADSDSNGIFDAAQTYLEKLLGTAVDLANDADVDGVTSVDELLAGTSPRAVDQAVAWISVEQSDANIEVCRINALGGFTTIRAEIGNLQVPYPTFDWSETDSAILDALIAPADGARIVIDPEMLADGWHTLKVKVTRDIEGTLVTSTIDKQIASFSAGGVNNAYDTDLDGICDSEDLQTTSIPALHTLPSLKGQVITETGTRLRLGLFNLRLGNIRSSMLPNTWRSMAVETGVTASLANDAAMTPISFIHDFELWNISAAGASVQVTYPYEVAITVIGDDGDILPEAVYRVWQASGWQTFTEDSKNRIESSLDSCDVATVFAPGLQEEGQCIRLWIEDGGSNDYDGQVNGMVRHSGVVSYDGTLEELEDELDDEPDDGGEGGDGGDGNTGDENEDVLGSEKVKTGKAGSSNLLLLALLGLGFMLRFWQKSQHSLRFFFAMLIGLSFSQALQADSFWHKTYVGAAVGQSSFDPEFSESIYELESDSDTSWKLFAGYHFYPWLSIEAEYANLGSPELLRITDQKTQTVDYTSTTISAMAQRYLWQETLAGFVRAGVGSSSVSASVPVELEDKYSPNLGVGLLWRFSPQWLSRLEFETFNKDSSMITLGVQYYLGVKKPAPIVQPSPVVSEPVAEPEPVEEVVEEVAEADVEEPVEEVVEPEPEPVTVTLDLPDELEEEMDELERKVDVYSGFEPGSAQLTCRMQTILLDVADFLKEYTEVQVVIKGHTDNIGDPEYNKRLSLARAKSTRNFFILEGVDESQIKISGGGEDDPLFDNSTEINRLKNRRVEIELIYGM
jgi:outer membrane protein OmpA-like peptidoglycan-associated protein